VKLLLEKEQKSLGPRVGLFNIELTEDLDGGGSYGPHMPFPAGVI